MKKIIIALQLLLVFGLMGCTSNNTVIPTETKKPSESILSTESPTDTMWYQNIKIDNKTEWSTPVVETDMDFYYITEDGVYQYTKKTRESDQVVFEAAKGLFLCRNDLYYNTEKQIKCMNLQTKKISVVWDETLFLNSEDSDKYHYFSIYDFMLADGYLYIAGTGTSVMRVNIESGETEAFMDDMGQMILLEGNCYYLDHAERTFSLYQINSDMQEGTLIRGEGHCEPELDSMLIDGIASMGDLLFYSVRNSSDVFLYHLDGNDQQIFDGDEGLYVHFAKGFSETRLCFYTTDGSQLSLYEYEHSAGVTLLATFSCTTRQCDVVITETAVFWWPEEESSVKCLVKK